MTHYQLISSKSERKRGIASSLALLTKPEGEE